MPFTVRIPEVDETLEPHILHDPQEAVKKLAERKAGAVVQEILGAEYVGAAAVIGADTMVVHNRRIFGKPTDEEDAKRILRELSGRVHQVLTGVSVWLISAPAKDSVSLGFRTLIETSHVTFNELTEDQIAAYVATKEPLDKAGAYGIQGKGGALVKGVAGDYDNVVGLPISRLLDEFSEIFEAAK